LTSFCIPAILYILINPSGALDTPSCESHKILQYGELSNDCLLSVAPWPSVLLRSIPLETHSPRSWWHPRRGEFHLWIWVRRLVQKILRFSGFRAP